MSAPGNSLLKNCFFMQPSSQIGWFWYYIRQVNSLFFSFGQHLKDQANRAEKPTPEPRNEKRTKNGNADKVPLNTNPFKTEHNGKGLKCTYGWIVLEKHNHERKPEQGVDNGTCHAVNGWVYLYVHSAHPADKFLDATEGADPCAI